MALSKEKQEQLAQAYKNIKKITGLKFDEKDVDQVANALGQIYINGHNLWRGIQNWGKIQSVIDARIFEVSDILNRVQKGNNADFISIMKPDDPYAVPRIIEPDTEEKREAAEAYEENFRENHRKNIAKLREDLAGSIIKNKMTDSRNYFREELLNEGGGFKNTNSYIRELGNRVTDAVNMCNTVLLGRGYTMEELLGDSEEVREARKMVGLEMEELMYGEISPEEKERKFRGFLEESKIGLEKLRMKHVDYSDDSTLDNARYNAMIASMVTNVYQVIQSAESTIQSPWLKEMDEYFVTLKNFTDGIGFLDNRRIQEINGIAVMADTMFNQLLIDRMGTDYDAYRTAPLGMAKNNCSLAFLMQNDIDDSAGSMGYDEAGEEYQKAYDKFAQTGSTEEYKKLLNDYVEKNETVFREAEKNIKIAAEGREILPKEDSYAAWFEGTPGMTVDDYKKGIREAFKGGSQTAQIDRSPTLSNLFLAYGVYEAEKNGQEISLQEFFTNRELQKETGRKAYEFFTNHPMTGKTEEESAENVKAFGQVIAALNRKLQNTEIPKYDYKDPEKAAEMQEYLKNFQTLMVDSHQLNGVIPKGLRDVFLEEQGGAEKYQETLNQINIAKAFVNAEQHVQAGRPLEKKNFKEIFDRTAVLSESCTGAYVLKTEGEKYLGKKIGECPTDMQVAKDLNIIIDTASGRIKGKMDEIAATREGRKQILEYAVSFGEKDPAGLDQKIKEEVAAISEQEKAIAEMMRQAEEEEKKAARENPKVKEPKVEEPKVEEAKAEELKAEELKAEEPKVEEPKAEELKAEKAGVEEPEAEETEEEISDEWGPEIEETEQKAGNQAEQEDPAYPWMDDEYEVYRDDYRERLQDLYDQLDSHDPLFLRSSAEYKAVKSGLKEAMKQMDQADELRYNGQENSDRHKEAIAKFNKAMGKVYQNSEAYLQKKKNAPIGKHYGQERLDAIRNVRELLYRQGPTLTGERAVDMFRIGAEYGKESFGNGQLKKENGLIRLGIYIQRAKETGNKADMQLLNKVVAERGKNGKSLQQLWKKLNALDAELPKEEQATERAEAMEKTKELLCRKISAQKGMSPEMISWCGVLEGFLDVAKESELGQVKEIARDQKVQKILLVGQIGARTWDIRRELQSSKAPRYFSSEDVGVMIANDTFEQLMAHKSKEDKAIFNSFLKDKKDVKEVTDYFDGLDMEKQFRRINDWEKDEKINRLDTAEARKIIGEQGKKEVIEKMLKINQKQHAPAQNAAQKQKPVNLQ